MIWRNLLLGLGTAVVAPSVAVAQARNLDPIVYREAVAAMLGKAAPETVMVGPLSVRLALPDTVVMRGGDVAERLAQFDAIPVGLPERLDSLSITPQPVARLGLPSGFAVLDDSSAALLWAGDWRALRRRVRVPTGVVHLTPVAYTAGGGTALVGMIWDCGPGCRRTMVAWLVPDGTGGWRVEGTHRFPMQ